MRLVLQGVLLFLFIPLVLFLYLRQPLGPTASILIGLAIMFGHRFLAAPWMARHATERCLWCGGGIGEASGHRFTVSTGRRAATVAACGEVHWDLAARFLTFITRYRLPIAIGIFVPLVMLLVASLALAAGRPLLPQQWNTWQFKTIVALTVVVTSLAYRTVPRADASLRSPFPLHNLFLLGIRNTLWVFRVVGAWWLVAGVLQILGR
jgi:hypothetical protein